MDTVSVVILNYNGNGHVERCIESVLQLTWFDLAVYVVDNASTDGSAEDVSRRFANRVKLIRRTSNSVTAGRNDGFRAANSKYVLSLDNDIILTDPMVLHKAVAIMKKNASAGALAFKIGSEDDPRYPLPEHWWHPVSLSRGHDQFFYSDWFPEGAVFFRASALAATNGYEEELVHGFECVDLALRLLDHGFDIIYSPSLTCIETRVRGRHYVTSSRMNYLCLRNRLWTAWKDLPAHRAVWYSLSRIIASALRAIRHGWLRSWFEAVHDGVVAPQRIRDKRHPIAPSTWKRIRMIRAGRYCPNPALPA